MKHYDQDQGRLLCGDFLNRQDKQGIYLTSLSTDRADDRVQVAHIIQKKDMNWRQGYVERGA